MFLIRLLFAEDVSTCLRRCGIAIQRVLCGPSIFVLLPSTLKGLVYTLRANIYLSYHYF